MGLREAARDRAKDYSLGMKQRLGLALALIGRPDVLLLDEPFNGLDPEGVRLVRRLLENLATQRECAVLVSSHVLDQLERLVDRYGILREGVLWPDDRRGGWKRPVATTCAWKLPKRPGLWRCLRALSRMPRSP